MDKNMEVTQTNGSSINEDPSETSNRKDSTSIPLEFRYLERLIRFRLNKFFPSGKDNFHPEFPQSGQWSPYLSEFIKENNLNENESTLLLIALAPHLHPDLFDRVIEGKLNGSGDFPRLGGVRGKNFRGFLPTGDTALFLLGGDFWNTRLEVQKLFGPEHFFAKKKMLWLEELPSGEPIMSGKIILFQEYIDYFIYGYISKPRFGINFPAQLLETAQEWDDLVLDHDTMNQILALELWIKQGNNFLNDWEMSKKIKPGYRVLFYGPSGTGKTLTASLLGKYTGKEVYKIDLSLVVSKFIGETEKNLAHLFDTAENKDWILFFDEADALFGKRTNVRDAHDKYANQEVSFLLQRTESFNGLVILATNFKTNIDDAFSRRFQSHIYFPVPKYEERVQLWQKSFPKKITLDHQSDLHALAKQYELTGAHIMNVVQYACLQSYSRNETIISYRDIIEGIRKEYAKEGKFL